MQHHSTNNTKNKNRGFTLVELMVALLIFTIIGGVLTSIFTSGLIFYGNENSQIENQEAINLVTISLEKDIRKTSALSISNGCLSMTQSGGVVNYCYDSTNKQVKRNSLITARNIDLFTFLINNTELAVSIRSIVDQRGETNTVSLRYYLREGNY